jgi:hypothetical protein
MLNFIDRIREDQKLSKMLKRERKANAEATARILRDQQIRNEVIMHLSANNLLKDGVC